MTNVEFTSDAVRSAKFREKFKGYHPEEVDSFLERAAVAIDQLTARLGETNARALKAEAALAGNSEADESVRRTLVLAQRTAEMAVREANEEASRIRAEATGEAERIRSDASRQAEQRLQEAEARATNLESEAERTHAAAIDHATATVDEADASAEATVKAAEERATALREDTDREVAEQHRRLAVELETMRADARREVEMAVAALRVQQEQLRADVTELADYLAGERARVLETLTAALDHFGTTLAPSPAPASLIPGEVEPEGAFVGEVEHDEAAMGEVASPVEVAEAQAAAEADDVAAEGDEPAVEEPAVEIEAPGAGEPAAEIEVPAGEGDDAAPVDEPVSGEPAAEIGAPAAEIEAPAAEIEDAAVAEVGGAAVLEAAPPSAGGEPTWWSWDEARRPEASPEPSSEVPWATTEGSTEAAPEPAAEVSAVAVVDDEPPARLLFTLEDEGRRLADHDAPEPAVDPKPRKTLLGRRRG